MEILGIGVAAELIGLAVQAVQVESGQSGVCKSSVVKVERDAGVYAQVL